MPPSPAVRCSPGREPRADNHKRGRSLESGIRLEQRDDDLALFNEVQTRETDNFLLQGNDDFEDIFTNKLRDFSDYKLGINIPARGESSDFLLAEEEKNDYEWLLTPPDTPLFPSLDDETPQVNLTQRGRSRTQPISISRSSTMEKSHRSSRGSASPNRVSLSPRSHNNTFECRGRATSAPSASPPTTFKPTATSLRSPPPSHKPASPLPRASTPTPPRRSSTGSNGTTIAKGISGISPVKTNSASPKIKAWQSTIPGFSTEVPPNLRTSLADRPASYVRGSSPASKSNRQSMSPTASRSISSSHSHEDDVECLPSVHVASSQRLNLRKVGGIKNNRGLISKKPSKTVSSSSAPKRSFDLALRQMDHRKGPQNMFRPLLSSVPSSTFHAGISSSPNHTMISMNSSMTTSSNASSGIEIIGAHDPESSHDDATSACVKMQDFDVDDEVFVIEKDDALDDSTNLGDRDPATLTNSLTFDDISDINSQKGLLICSKCGCAYTPIGLENETNLCVDCIESYSPLTIVDPETEVTTMVEPQLTLVEVKPRSGQHDDVIKDSQSTYAEPIWNFLSENSIARSRSEECETKKVNHDTVDFSKSLEGAGISLLLKRSSSIKGAVVRNTNFSASSISYDDFSYVNNSINSMRSVSASSSVDFGVNKQMDTRFQRQLSSTKSEIENYKYDLNVKHHRSGSSMSGTSSHAAFHPSSSSGRDVQENNEENDVFTLENNNEYNSQTSLIQTRVDSEESLLSNCLQVEEIQKAEESGPHDTNTDVVEASLDAILEGEFDQTGRSSSASKCNDSQSSTSNIEELQEDVAVSALDHDTSNQTSNINVAEESESIVLIEHEGGSKGRSLTLEEATDAILFCSSIVHNLAHKAATIASEKENQLNDNGSSWPLIPATRKSELDKPDLQSRKNTTKRSSNSERLKQIKEAETDTTTETETETVVKTDQPKTRIVGVRDFNNGESKKLPMLESKCNCTIM